MCIYIYKGILFMILLRNIVYGMSDDDHVWAAIFKEIFSHLHADDDCFYTPGGFFL